MEMLGLRKVTALALVVGALVFFGCGTPSSQKAVDSAIEWIEETDCQAIPKGLGTQQWWLYGNEGRMTVGLAGGLMVEGRTIYVRTALVQGPGEEAAAPRWIRFSPANLKDDELVEEAKEVLGTWLYAVFLDPLLAMRSLVTAGEPSATADGLAWIVVGKLDTSVLYERLLGPTASRRLIELKRLPDMEVAVTIIVDKATGRPLETSIERIPGSPADAISYTWTRGVWSPWDEDVIDFNDYLDQRED